MSKHSKTQSAPAVEGFDPEVKAEAIATVLTINSAAALTGLSTIYIRKAIREGKLPTTLVPTGEGSQTMKHTFTSEAFETWRNSVGASRSRREDGRNKFNLYATADELAKIQALLAANELQVPIEKANVKKVFEAETEAEPA